MPELRRDPICGNWVILSPERKKRPRYFKTVVHEDSTKPEDCPFCPGNEEMTPPELHAVRKTGSAANGPGWELRVVPNRYPALRVEGELTRSGDGIYDRISGIGAHEVIIDHEGHAPFWDLLQPGTLARLLSAVQSRILDLKRDIRFQYILAFKNCGLTAGATLYHSHSQLLALPVIPPRIDAELAGAMRHFNGKERCLFCDILKFERDWQKRFLMENEHFSVFAPYASRFPFEMSVYPREHQPAFETIREKSIGPLASILFDMLQRIRKALGPVDFHLVLHTAPLLEGDHGYYHWHWEFWPVLNQFAGFEWGSGMAINPVPPEEAVQVLADFSR